MSSLTRMAKPLPSPDACSTNQSPPWSLLDGALEEIHRRRSDEAGDEHVPGIVVEGDGIRDLLDDAVLHDHDAVAHGHGFDLIVGDVDHGGLEAVVELGNFGAHLHAHFGVEVRERFVEEEGLRFADDGAADGDALALAAGERLGFALELFVGDAEDLGGFADALVDLGFRVLAQHQAERHVFVDGHVRIERVVLEDHGDVAIFGRNVVDALAVDENVAAGDFLEARDHAERGGFAAAGRADEHDEFLVADFEVGGIDGCDAAGVDLGHVFEENLCHSESFSIRIRTEARWGSL